MCSWMDSERVEFQRPAKKSPWGECANPACQHLLEMWRCLQECVWCSLDYFPAEAWIKDLSAFPASQPQTKLFLNLPGLALRESQVRDHLQIWCGIRWELGTCCCGGFWIEDCSRWFLGWAEHSFGSSSTLDGNPPLCHHDDHLLGLHESESWTRWDRAMTFLGRKSGEFLNWV